MATKKETANKPATQAKGKQAKVDPNESKADRFKRLAVRRTRKVIMYINNIGNCSNKGVYDYTEAQVKHIFDEIEKSIVSARDKFAKAQAVAEGKKAQDAFDLK